MVGIYEPPDLLLSYRNHQLRVGRSGRRIVAGGEAKKLKLNMILKS